MFCRLYFFVTIFASCIQLYNFYDDAPYGPDFLDMDPDSILEENALITANATCGQSRREYYCRLVEHADGRSLYKRSPDNMQRISQYGYQESPRSYRDPSGQWVQCSFCDARDPQLSHPIEYVLRGEPHLWWQSPSLAEGLHYHAVTITMDFSQVYQIVYVLLRMGDSPRPANWILERSLDGVNYKPWVFFAESEYDCKRLYQPMLDEHLTVTSGPRPWMLRDDEVYCTTFYSQPQALQSGEIIVTLSLDRASTIPGPAGMERAISSKLIDFLSARYVRLRFQKLQTLSGDWMAMPNQLDSSVYNRYYYSIRTIKVGGKCLCNSHANKCEQRVVDGVPRAVCVCQHNTCGSNCEICCPMFNQQLWRPGAVCEECNCHGKADSCVFNQTVANLRLSKRKDGQYVGGGVCVDCREDTTGINCESCKPGYYRPLNVRPESPYPCVKCNCDSYGSTGECVSNDARMPELYPGDCICKEGFSGKRCDQCAEGFRRSEIDPSQCVPCTCDIRGSRSGGGYKCEPPCNCKVNVDPSSFCRQCQPGHFNLDSNNPEGCQACYCSGLTNQCDGISSATAQMLEQNGLLGTVSTLSDWKIIVPSAPAESGYPVPYNGMGVTGEEIPLRVDTRTVESWLSSATLQSVDRGYYWSAPKEYLQKRITSYLGTLSVILSFHSPTINRLVGNLDRESHRGASSLAFRDQLEYMWLNEPDIVLEGNGFRLVHVIPSVQRDSHMIINIPLNESSFRVLVEPPSSVSVDKIPIGLSQGTIDRSRPYDDGPRGYEQAGRPATVADMIAALSRLDRLLIKVKHIGDQTTAELRQVDLKSVERDENGRIPNLEECVCPPGHTGTSCESCAFGYWRDPNQQVSEDMRQKLRGMWRQFGPTMQPMCVPCECNGHTDQCDEQTGKCIGCQHNTAGDRCDKCAPGFYGDPSSGSLNACQPCECPNLTNQKTDICMANEKPEFNEEKPYICLDCQDNTRGRYCELCAPGYFGEPSKGIPCQKCQCGQGAIGCNDTTGVCTCGFNTAGPKCDVCAEGTHGDPALGQPCRPCNCHEKGSVSSTCRAGDGQCTCHPGYEGVRCERCSIGRGNVDAGCPPCQCSPIGTKPNALIPCDPVTGQCSCKDGVGGTLDCSQCLPGYYNLGPHGCQVCQCSTRAIDLICDPDTGKCKCGENVLGDTCDKCRAGHYWNVTGPNCLPCDCGIGTKPTASLGFTADCNMQTGQCSCAPHVTGRRCTECEPGYFGVTAEGCQPCPMCPNGQVCDQITGKCICPPNTQGDRCEECSPGSWEYNPILGCKSCNCSTTGTESGELDKCDVKSGQCSCKTGFTGRACDQCAPGHYGYPKCDKCECDARGTVRQNRTIDSATMCNQTDGSCQCKENVQGQRCDECKPGTFGLSIDYDLGCYTCFCFPTDSTPQCSLLTGYRSVPGKEKGVEIIATDSVSSPGGPLIQLDIGLGYQTGTELAIGVSQFNWRFSAHRPTFLEIPELKGALTRNYGSAVIAISTECLPTGDCALTAPESAYPTTDLIIPGGDATTDQAGSLIVRRPYRIDARMVSLGAQIHLEYQPADDVQTTKVDGFRQIWLRESDWVLTHVAGVDTRVRPTRNELMLALLNVTSFSVRLFMPEAKPKLVSVKYRVYEALSETATAAGTQIRSIEKCDCPTTSSGDHCEIASPGFYFPPISPKPGPSIKPTDPDSKPPPRPSNIEWIGGVEKCHCHGMSSHCNPITGVCEACTGNTMGPDCGQCAVGYTGDPKLGQLCVKCQCPTEQTDYALTCYPAPDRPYLTHHCICKPGYTGERCEDCAPGYFGDPLSMTACQPCDCDKAGSKSDNCAKDTGQCPCWPGILGRRCDQCEPDHVVDGGRCVDCRGECTGELMTKADDVKRQIDNLNVTSLAYQGLARMGQQVDTVRQRFSDEQLQRENELVIQTQNVAKQTVELKNKATMAKNAKETVEKLRCESLGNVTELGNSIKQLDQQITDWVRRLSELPMTQPSADQVQRWLEDARRVRAELEAINLQVTQEWVDEAKQKINELLASADEIVDAVRPGRSVVELEQIAAYQDQQDVLLQSQSAQVYRIGNATQQSKDEMMAAQNKAESLKKAATEALDLGIIQNFDEQAESLKSELDKGAGVPPGELEKRLNEAKAALKQLALVDLPPSDRLHISPNLDPQYVTPLEREAESIQMILRQSNKVNRTLDAYNAYQTIVDNMKRAETATSEAEDALKRSMTSGGQSWQDMITTVSERKQAMTKQIDSKQEFLVSNREKLNVALEPLAKAESDLDQIQQTADKTVADSKDVMAKVSKVEQLVSDTKPQVKNVSAMTETQDEKLRGLRDRLQSVETRYSQLQGTAHSAVDQANNSQSDLIKILGETESTVKRLDTKLLRMRRLSAEVRSLLDVTYGSLAKDPVPLRIEPKCVYTLVPYSVGKSNVFDIEFWFRLHTQPAKTGSVLLVGRRAFTGRTQMFSFTVEPTGPKLRFSWNVIDGTLELGSIGVGTWYQVRVVSQWGITRMMLLERPDEDSQVPAYREVTSHAGASNPEAALLLDRQMEIRVGGAIHSGAKLLNPESWGSNGAESLWARLMTMESTEFCIFNLRLGGVHLGLMNFAMQPGCSAPQEMKCKLRHSYRSLARNGYVWRPQSETTNLTTEARPVQSTHPNYLLQRMFYYDFAGTGGYARLKQFKDLRFCEDRVQFQLTPLSLARRNPMMVFTFYNFDQDMGVTLELINGVPKATAWKGLNLYRSADESNGLDMSEVLRRRVLRTTSYSPRQVRTAGVSANSARSKWDWPVTQSDLTIGLWRVDKLLTENCKDDVILFVGAIPPGHYSIRRRMHELGLTLNPFAGRVGITNERPSQIGGLFLEEYVREPVTRLGDSQFTDLRQQGEALVVQNLEPNGQYCLRLNPTPETEQDLGQIQLNKTVLESPWEPGISMTVHFNPSSTPSESIGLLRLQMLSAEWLLIKLTEDYRLSLVIPGASAELVTHQSLVDKPLQDPAVSLLELESKEARSVNASLPAWSDIPDPLNQQGAAFSDVGTSQVVITLHFSKADSKRLDVLFDNRLVQSWTIPTQASVGPIDQALVGPFKPVKHPITISHLLIGRHLVDFSKELTVGVGRSGVHVSSCGGQLHPRFLEREWLVESLRVVQGLDMEPPPSGRQLRFLGAKNISDSEQIGRKGECTANPDKTAWFDKSPGSFWELSDLGAPIKQNNEPFEFAIGFRAQLSPGVKSRAVQDSAETKTPVQYNLLAAFNFGPEKGNLYLILSHSQIFVTNANRVLWASQHLTISDASWHYLKIRIPQDDSNTGNNVNDPNGAGNGYGVGSGVYLIFDGRHMWLPRILSNNLPILALIGGLPSTSRLTLHPNENIAPIVNLFGCVDEVTINGVSFNPQESGRPKCYDCFSLDPSIVHVPPSVQAYLEHKLVPMDIPAGFTENTIDTMTFDFSFFYDREKNPSASLFIMLFEETDTMREYTAWVYVHNVDVKMVFPDDTGNLGDYGHSVKLITPPVNQNTWNYIEFDVMYVDIIMLMTLRSQVERSYPHALPVKPSRLKAIYFGRSSLVSEKLVKTALGSNSDGPLAGCLRDMHLKINGMSTNVKFPIDVPDLLKGVCHTSKI